MSEKTDDFILQTMDLRKHYPIKQKGIVSSNKIGDIKALDGINLSIKRGEILGIVGESGSGKTTLARVILNLIRPTSGSTILKPNQSIDTAGQNNASDSKQDLNLNQIEEFEIYQPHTREELLWFRKKCQIVFQDPYSSLNPRMTVLNIIF